MPFTKGTISLRRYTLPAPPSNLLDCATLAIRRYSWRPINDERGESQSFGWINPRSPLQQLFNVEEILDNGIMLLAVRQDTKRLNHTLFHAHLRQRIEEVCKARNLTKLSRQHRLAIEEETRVEMMRGQTPLTGFCEVLWDLHNNTLLVASPTNTANDLVREVFINTFDLTPIRQTGFPPCEDGSNLNAEALATAGAQFLTNLMITLQEGSQQPSYPSLEIHLEGPLVFAHPEHDARKITIVGEDAASSPEAEAALQSGKRLQSAVIVIQKHEEVWRMTLDATTMTLKAVSLPVPTLPDINEYIYLRHQSLTYLHAILDELLQDQLAQLKHQLVLP